MFNPNDWYWLADDGRLFSSKQSTLIATDDSDYVVWAELNVATPWPRDDAGEQTDASLQVVLAPYNLFANLTYYTPYRRWRKEQGGLTTSFGMPVKTDDRSQAKITGIYNAQQVQPLVVTDFHAADGTIHQLDAAQIGLLNKELLTHINNCFAVSSDVLAGIADGSITTREQVDAAFDAPMTQARKDWLKT
jgi:hypothetical protein